MTELGLFDRDRIRALLGDVAGELAGTSSRHTIVIVGGSLLAWHGLREATADVDTVQPITGELRNAVALVAARNHLAVGWLNDHAAAWAPATFNVDACDVLIDGPHLLVLGMPLRGVFLMKLSRALPADLDDMRAMWPHVAEEFTSAADVVAAFEEAFPLEPADEYLAGFVVAELAKGGFKLPPT